MSPLDGKQWCIPYVYVKPEFRNKGISKGLLEKLFSMAKENGEMCIRDRHKEWERHSSQNLPPYGAADLFPFAYRCDQSENEYGQAEVQKALSDGGEHRQHIGSVCESEYGLSLIHI